MAEDLTDFWVNRYSEIGHTGWKDPIIYAYDQIERLAIISDKIEGIDVWPTIAIDFGCGTGDFSRLMLEEGFKVWGYDPYVSPDVSHPRFAYVAELEGIESDEVGLILSVTVLDHILHNDELEAELDHLRDKISEQGLLLMLEYALDKSVPTSNKYQAFRTINEWRSHLEMTGWKVSSIEMVPHPKAAPSAGFTHYRRSMPMRLLRKLFKYYFLQSFFFEPLRMYAERVFDQHGIGKVDKSPLKLITCRPCQVRHSHK
jgi:hypothetical protein